MIPLSHHNLPLRRHDGTNSKFPRFRNLLLPKFKFRFPPFRRHRHRHRRRKIASSKSLAVSSFLITRQTLSASPSSSSTTTMDDSSPPSRHRGGGLAGGGHAPLRSLSLTPDAVELLGLSDPPEDRGPWIFVSGPDDIDSPQTLDPAAVPPPEIGASSSQPNRDEVLPDVVDFNSAFTSSRNPAQQSSADFEPQPSGGEAVVGESSAFLSGEIGMDAVGDHQNPASHMETEADASAPSSPTGRFGDEDESDDNKQPLTVGYSPRSRTGADEFHRLGCPARNGRSWCQCPPWMDRGRSDSEDEQDRPRGVFLPWMKERAPTGLGAGLSNLGNTCFINAILQCFTHTVPLVKALRAHSHSLPCERGSDGFCVLDALRDHIDCSLNSSGRIIAPRRLFDNLTSISSLFQRYQQEDAHEFLQCLLDRLERCCLDPNPVEGSSSSKADNIVQQIFGGRLVSKLKCCSCGHLSDKYEPLIDLSLEIEEVDNLHDALESFTKVEKIEDPEAKPTCDSCKEKVTMEKQFMLDRAPLVTTLHLKRFKADGHSVEKIGKHVEFPLELDLMPYSSHDQKDEEVLKYQLYGVVVHNGFSPTSGHYFCYIRSSPGTWHKLDDSRVTECGEEYVLSQVAYLLLYAREGTPWFSSLMDSQKVCQDLGTLSTSPKSVLQTMDAEEYASSDNNSKENGDNCDDAAAAVLTGDAVIILEPQFESPRESCVVQDELVEILKQNKGEGSAEGPSYCDDETKGCARPLSSPATAAADILQATREPQDIDDEKTGRDDGGRPFQSQIPFTHSGRAANFVRLPETRYRNPREQNSKTGNLVAEERVCRKGGKDPQTSEAVRYMNKTMPSSRRNQLMAAIGHPNEVKKKGGLRSSTCSSKRSNSPDPSRRVLRRTEAMR